MRKIIRKNEDTGQYETFVIGKREEQNEPQELEPTPEEIMQETLAQCEIMKKEAQKKAEDVCTDACRQGYEQGRDQGHKEAVAELAGLLKAVSRIEEDLRAQKKQALEQAEKELVDLVIGIAGRIVRHELEHTREIVLRAIRDSLPYLADKDEIIIRVNPDDFKTVHDATEQIKREDASIVKIEILQDEKVPEGGAIVQSPSGSIDTNSEVLLAQFTEELKKLAPKIQAAEEQ